ncbi:MAG: molybdopterin-dependent oxidoreductase [Roseobacter sp.]
MLRIVIPALIAFTLSATMGNAQDLELPKSDVILTVSGEIDFTNKDDLAVFDLEMLQGFPSTIVETSTIWTTGQQRFQGISLFDLLTRLGVKNGTLKATAINDYFVEIPVSDAILGGPIIAYHLNGEEMSIRDKGPLWIVYPYDDKADYRSETIYSRSIWQLDRIKAE